MTTIHMDTEAMRQIQKDLVRVRERLQNKMMALHRNYQGLPHNWIANSATEYFDYYSEIDSNITGVMNRLEEIASELLTEIANYESLDDGLAG